MLEPTQEVQKGVKGGTVLKKKKLKKEILCKYQQYQTVRLMDSQAEVKNALSTLLDHIPVPF